MGKREFSALSKGRNSQQNQGIRFLQSTLLLVIVFALAGCEITSLNSPDAAAPATSTRTRFSPVSLVGNSSTMCAVSALGSVRCWGDDTTGVMGTSALGLGTQASDMGDNLSTLNVGTGRTISSLSVTAGGTGLSSVCAMLDNSTLKCWGYNTRGALGQGDTTNLFSPATINAIDLGTGRTVKSVGGGGSIHRCVILDNDTVKCWGYNQYGQLGQGDTSDRGDGLNEMGDNLATIDLGAGLTAKKVVTSYTNTCAQLNDNTVKCWGFGGWGGLGGSNVTLGDGPGEMGNALAVVNLGTGRTAKDISAGRDHFCAILDNDQVKCWGLNAQGQLGYGDTTTRGTAGAQMGDALAYVDLGTGRTALKLALGNKFSCAILDNNTTKCWGYNAYGQLGQGHINSLGDGAAEMGDNLTAIDLGTGRTATAIAVGATHACALLDNATVKCWGQNLSGTLGLGDENSRGYMAGQMGDNLAAVSLGTGRTATALAVGDGGISCAKLDNGSWKCWGVNAKGQLGLGYSSMIGDEATDTYVSLDLGGKVRSLALGGAASSLGWACAVLVGGSVKCWGLNQYGHLGLGDKVDRVLSSSVTTVDLGTGRTATTITAGNGHTCALLDNGTVKCWGNNFYQLGLGDTNDRGDGPGEMGDNLTAIDLGTGRTAVDVQAGLVFTCALLDNATVKCWGFNSVGQLGQGHTNTLGDGPGEMGDNLTAIDLGTGRTAKAIYTHATSACALLDNDTVKCWGSNSTGDLGQGHTNNLGDGAGEMGDNLTAISLGTGRTAKKLGGGYQHSCAILDNNTTKCWGSNSAGLLGQGHTNTLGDGAGEMGDNLGTIDWGSGRYAVSLAVAPTNGSNVCAILDNDTIKCTGSNFSGLPHVGSANSVDYRGDAAGETGDALSAIDLGYE